MSVGAFVWYDLATLDQSAAADFYYHVVGWDPEPVPEMAYTVLHSGGAQLAGMMTLPPNLRDAGVPPHWKGYIHVADVDAMCQTATQHGGVLKYGPEDIPGVGRFAVMTDPEGAAFHLFTPTAAPAAPPADAMTPGHIGWRELHTTDHRKAFDFYGALFGWTPTQAIDMGPMGTYQLYAYDGADRGGMMNAPPGMHPHWLFYIVVDGLDAAKSRIDHAGGSVMNGPVEVPGGAWVLQARDPQGAAFALVSAHK